MDRFDDHMHTHAMPLAGVHKSNQKVVVEIDHNLAGCGKRRLLKDEHYCTTIGKPRASLSYVLKQDTCMNGLNLHPEITGLPATAPSHEQPELCTAFDTPCYDQYRTCEVPAVSS